MKYQRARIINGESNTALRPGMLVWVRMGPAQKIPLVNFYTGQAKEPGFRLLTNIKGRHPDSMGLAFKPERAELLARGPEDFAEDLPMISYQEFLESQEKSGS